MRALRKTGVRAPFQPGPILEAGAVPPSEMLRPVVVIGAIVPALLLGGVTRPIGIPTRDANVDPRRPTVVTQGQQPVPDARTQFVNRPAPPEDTSRPARPAVVVGVGVPIPGASVWLGTPAHEPPGAQPDRALQETAQIIRGQQPVPGALALVVSRVAIVEDVQWPARPAVVRQGQQPVPGAIALATYAPRDQVAAQPDRVVQEQAAVLVGQQPLPQGAAVRVGRITSTPTDPIRPAAVVVERPPIPGARLAWVGVAHDGDRLRAMGPMVWAPPPPVPGVQVQRVGYAFQQPLFGSVFRPGTITGSGAAARTRGAASGGQVVGATDESEVES